MISDAIKGLDRQILQALQIDGRASLARIADVLGVSDQTIARRYSRLRAERQISVVGLSEPLAVGDVPWLVRVRCTPDAASSVANALARREDTQWVHLISGGTEITASVRARDDASGDELLLQRLPRTPRVVDLAAQCILHTYFGGTDSPLTKTTALAPEQVAALTPAPVTAVRGPVRLDDADRRLLAVLARDGRATIDELAGVTAWSATTVRRRVAQLRACGALYFDVDVDSRLLGYGVTAMLWLTVAPARMDDVGEALAAHPEVAFAAATTGVTHLYATVACHDVPALYDYLTTRLAALPSVTGVETAPVMRTFKRSGAVLRV